MLHRYRGVFYVFVQFSVERTTDGFFLFADEEYFIGVCAVDGSGSVSDPVLLNVTMGKLQKSLVK